MKIIQVLFTRSNMLIITKSQINQEQGSKNIFVEKSAPVPEAKKLHAK